MPVPGGGISSLSNEDRDPLSGDREPEGKSCY